LVGNVEFLQRATVQEQNIAKSQKEVHQNRTFWTQNLQVMDRCIL